MNKVLCTLRFASFQLNSFSPVVQFSACISPSRQLLNLYKAGSIGILRLHRMADRITVTVFLHPT